MSDWRRLEAPAKLNLALVVGPRRPDGMHEVVTVMERLTLADTIGVRRAQFTSVDGFDDDTLVRGALDEVTRRVAGATGFEARIDKRIPVAAGLGGGSSDAVAALRLANDLLETPLRFDELDSIAASLGADLPFFLREGAQLGTGDGTTLAGVTLPRAYTVLLVLPAGVRKSATADVYAAFDERRGEGGYAERRARALATLDGLTAETDLAALPPNDLASSPLSEELRRLGAFRADVTGAGPVVYGLFVERAAAERAQDVLGSDLAGSWIAEPR
jgi:4-diphosphocytidyl-2-C-methyl-D-erythritol kinase